MRRSLLPLFAIRAFEAVARHENFQKAADELGVTSSAVSRQVAEMERILGGRLLVRSVRKVELNDDGRFLQQRLSQALDDIAESIEAVQSRRKAGVAQKPNLLVRALPTVAVRLVIPYLPFFESEHPDFSVTLAVTTELAPRKQLENVAIEYDRTSPAERSVVLFQEIALPVCGPDYLAAAASRQPLLPQEIFGLRLLTATSDSWEWRMWAKHQSLPWPQAPNLMQFETDDLAIQAALSNSGIALVEQRFIASELADKRLVLVTRDGSVPLGYYYVRVNESGNSEFVKVFVGWLLGIVERLDSKYEGSLQ